jgi:NAD(P)-dependent dehydrogenase (short-subunit alcohol dehydrogenase family)
VKVFAKAVDVANSSDLKAFIAESAEALGGIDVLVSNVSAGGVAQGEAAWRANFEIDLLGTVRACEAALPHLLKSGAGSIVVIGTTAAVAARPAPTRSRRRWSTTPRVWRTLSPSRTCA